MKTKGFLPALSFMVLAAFAVAASFPAKTGGIQTSARIFTDNGGKSYRVTVDVVERGVAGSPSKLPSIGVSQLIGSPAQTSEIVGHDGLLVELKTNSNAGEKTVHCTVSVTLKNETPVQSDFELTLP